MSAIASVGALLLSVALLLMGNGLQGTLLPVRAEMEAFEPISIGVMGSLYFLGFAIGCLAGPFVVARVGHIRTFAAGAALASTVALIHALAVSPVAWWILRALTGLSLAILYMVIESWLNERATNESRGTVMSIYTVINLVTIMIGQMLLTLYPPNSFPPFALASILVSLATLPVALSASTAPAPLKTVKLRFLHLYKASPVGWIGALSVGLGNGAFWSLGPVFARDSGLDIAGIALFMSLVVLGGALGQLPLGRLSDRMDRRRVILGCAIGAAVVGAALPVVAATYTQGLLVGSFMFGLTALPIYATCVAHMNDHVESDGFVEASTCMLLLFAAGAMVGPLLASLLTGVFGFVALFPYIGAIYLCLAGFVVLRMRMRDAPKSEDKTDFVNTPSTSPVVNVLDPRNDGDQGAAADPENFRETDEAPASSQDAATQHENLETPPTAGGSAPLPERKSEENP